VHVLYLEQLCLKLSLSGGGCDGSFSQRVTCSGSGVPSSCMSSRMDNYASLRWENRELKLEVSRVQVRMIELEREQGLMKQCSWRHCPGASGGSRCSSRLRQSRRGGRRARSARMGRRRACGRRRCPSCRDICDYNIPNAAL
jgi:hypothetical protein